MSCHHGDMIYTNYKQRILHYIIADGGVTSSQTETPPKYKISRLRPGIRCSTRSPRIFDEGCYAMTATKVQIILPQTRCVRESPASHLRQRVLGQTHGPWRAYDHHQTASSRTGNHASMGLVVVRSSTKGTAGPSDDSDSDARQQKKKKRLLDGFSAFAFRRLLRLELEGTHL
jgi:hypothetical protein